MLSWLIRLSRVYSDRSTPGPSGGRDALLSERRRLQDLLDSYREFGFDTLIPSCKERIRSLDLEIRRLREDRGRVACSGESPG
jgi:hypothetical protein